MTNAELEAWVQELVARAVAGNTIEDAVVECKAALPETPNKAARQLAGFANAARATEVLLLVGVDDDAHQLTGARVTDSAQWWTQVQKAFDGPAPELVIAIDVRTPTGVVHAMLLGTARAPFVVRVPDRPDGLLEVPWRVATGTRSARHEELLEVIVPRVAAPRFEILDAWLEIRQQVERETLWTLHVTAYIETKSQAIFPDHRAQAFVATSPHALSNWGVQFWDVQLRAPYSGAPATHPHYGRGASVATTDLIRQGRNQLIADGPGRIVIEALLVRPGPPPPLFGVEEVDIQMLCWAVGHDTPVEIRLELEQKSPAIGDDTIVARWQLNPRRRRD